MPRSRRMEDMARRTQDMRDRRRNMRDMRRNQERYDGRNPYGSQGGYVSSRRTRDMLMYDDMRRYRENPSNYNLSDMTRQNREIEHDPYTPYQYGRDYRKENYDGHYSYPYYMNFDYGTYSRNRDYGSDKNYLNDEELMAWKETLLEEIDPQYKNQFEKNRVVQRAKEMGVQFKDFTEDEFVTTAIMIASDFGKTVGMNNTDQMFRMAYDWLDDKDAGVKGSEKLAIYYDEIVCADD